MNDIAATRRASASGSSGGASSTSTPRPPRPVPRCSPAPLTSRIESNARLRQRDLLRIHVHREARRRVLALGGHLLHRLAHGGDCGSRSGERITSCARWRAWRRNSGAGPSAGTPAAVTSSRIAVGRRELRARLDRRAHDPDQVAVRRIAEQLAAPQLGLEEAVGVVARGEAERLGRRVERLHDHAAAALAATAAARRAGPRARRCAPRRGSPGSAAWRPHRAPRRASRPGSRGPSPPSGCPRARRRAPRRSAAARSRRPPRRRCPSRAGTPAAAPRAPRARAPAARSRPRAAPPTPTRSRGTRAARARGGRSGGRPPRRGRGGARA